MVNAWIPIHWWPIINLGGFSSVVSEKHSHGSDRISPSPDSEVQSNHVRKIESFKKIAKFKSCMSIAQRRGHNGAQWSVPCCSVLRKIWGEARIWRVQVLFLLGFSQTCWGANNKTQAVHRFGFDKSTVSISLREKIAAEMKGNGGWGCFWC